MVAFLSNPVVQSGLISAGSKLFGRLFGGNKDADLERARQDGFYQQNRADQWALVKNRLQYTVADAQKAGIHPLYALGAASGGGGFAATIPGQTATGSFEGDGIASAGQAVANTISAAAREREAKAEAAEVRKDRALNRRRVEAEIERLQTETRITEEQAALSKLALLKEKTRHDKGAFSESLGQTHYKAGEFGQGSARKPVTAPPNVVDITMGGKPVRTSGNYSPASVVEEELGEFGEFLFSMMSTGDFLGNAISRNLWDSQRKFKKGMTDEEARAHGRRATRRARIQEIRRQVHHARRQRHRHFVRQQRRR
jgi:hypothetical protein